MNSLNRTVRQALLHIGYDRLDVLFAIPDRIDATCLYHLRGSIPTKDAPRCLRRTTVRNQFHHRSLIFCVQR